jgi:transcriptional regulator with XRE-family HTH domain
MQMATEPLPFGVRLQEMRRAAGLSQQQLATAAGLSLSLIAQLEQGAKLDPKVSTLRALAKVLGVTTHDLIRDVEFVRRPSSPEPKED